AAARRSLGKRSRRSSGSSGSQAGGLARRSRNHALSRRSRGSAASPAIESTGRRWGSICSFANAWAPKEKGIRSDAFLILHLLLFSSSSSGLAGRQFLFDTCRFARALTQVVQLRTAHITTTLDFDRSDQ